MKNTILSICFQGNYKAVFHTGGVLSESVRLIQLGDGPLKSDGEVGKKQNKLCMLSLCKCQKGNSNTRPRKIPARRSAREKQLCKQNIPTHPPSVSNDPSLIQSYSDQTKLTSTTSFSLIIFCCYHNAIL